MYALSFLGEAMVVFEAEISKGHGVTKWYKNGTEIKDNNRFKLKIDGKKQRLEIVKVWEADAGEYKEFFIWQGFFFQLYSFKFVF